MARTATHVIFDLDGTLLDTESLYTRSARVVCERYGAEYTLELKRRIMGGDTLHGARVVVEALSLPITPEEYIDIRGRELGFLLEGVVAMPGAQQLIESLVARGVPMAIATSGHRAITERKFELAPWLRAVPTVVCGDDPRLLHPKPAPDIYLLAASDLRAQPAHCAVLEDSLNGVLSAAAAGMRTIALVDPQWGFDPALFTPHASVVSSLHQVTLDLLGLAS